MTPILEFWPDHNSGPLWSSDGTSVDLLSLGIPGELAERLTKWNARYNDAKLPFETNDAEWLRQGTELRQDVRAALGSAYEIVVAEPGWGEEPSA